MKAHIVLAHPEANSFNGALAQVSRETLSAQGWDCTVSDLYRMDFDPREGAQHYRTRANEAAFHPQTEQRYSAENGSLPGVVSAEIGHILSSDLLIVHFPLWWFGMPAILKGWMDRVFVYGELYRSTQRYDTGRCQGKRMLACVTTGASAENCAPNGREGNTRLHLWPILYPFRYLGYTVLEPVVLHGIGAVAYMEGYEEGLSTVEAGKGQWGEALSALEARPTVRYNSDEDFDENKQLRAGMATYSPFIRHPA